MLNASDFIILVRSSWDRRSLSLGVTCLLYGFLGEDVFNWTTTVLLIMVKVLIRDKIKIWRENELHNSVDSPVAEGCESYVTDTPGVDVMAI